MEHDMKSIQEPGFVTLESSAGRWVLAAAVTGSALSMITGTVVNVALPAIGESLRAGTAALQWVLNGYLLALASLILIGGALGDRFGHRRIFAIGAVSFAITSVLCALAPTVEWLIGLRIAQGVAAALLIPESLAIIETVFRPEDRGKAIGAWSALGGIAAAVGPLIGGLLVDAGSWRAVFLLNVPLAAAVVWIAATHVPETRPREAGRLDLAGAGAAFLALGALTFALIQGQPMGFDSAPVLGAAAGGAVALAGFLVLESRVSDPMMPLEMFADDQFAAGNLVTFVVYAALGGVFFLLVVFLQNGLGYSALEAGAALLPITALLLMLSSGAGDFAQSRGARIPLTAGPLLLAVGLVLMSTIRPGDAYVSGVLPSMLVFGLGLAATVAPVTATVLAAAKPGQAGAASGINNAISRTAQLVAVAVFPALAGLTGDDLARPETLAAGFPRAALAMAAVAALGGALAWITISPHPLAAAHEAPGRTDQPGMPEEPDVPVEPDVPMESVFVRICPVDGTPLRVEADRA